MSINVKVTSPGRAELAALNGLLEQQKVPAASRATVLEAAAIAQASDISVVGEPSDDVHGVELHPTNCPAAGYVSPARLCLRFDRRRAVRTCQEYEFCTIEHGTPPAQAWQLVTIEPWAVEQHAVVVRRLLLSAFIIAAAQAAQAAQATAPARNGATRAPRTATGTTRPAASSAERPARTAARSATARQPARPAATRPAKAARPEPPPVVKPAMCAVHFVALVNGRCDYCDS